MTDPMISPEQPLSRKAVRTAEGRAALVELAFGGVRRAVDDLARDRADLPVSHRHGRERDLSTPGGRVRYGFLGETARNALADLLDLYEARPETRDLPVQLVAAFEDVRQALRLSALVDDEQQLSVCPTCSALGDALGGRVTAIESVRGQL